MKTPHGQKPLTPPPRPLEQLLMFAELDDALPSYLHECSACGVQVWHLSTPPKPDGIHRAPPNPYCGGTWLPVAYEKLMAALKTGQI